MPRPKVDQDWVTVIYSLKANEPKLGARAILTRLQKARNDGGISEKCPGLRTVGRYLKEWPGLPEEERRLYRELSWPESFERGDLPWEASQAALELLRVWAWPPPMLETMFEPEALQSLGLSYPTARPSIRLARWFWRLTQAAPDADASERRKIAEWLEAAEVLRSEPADRAVEAWLQYAPWRSAGASAAYEKALHEDRAIRFRFTYHAAKEEL